MKKQVNDKSGVTKRNEKEVSAEAVNILSTLDQLVQDSTINNLVRILTGTAGTYLVDPHEEELPNYGIMSDQSPGFIYRVVQILIDEEMLTLKKGSTWALEITSKGHRFMKKPEKLIAPKYKLRLTSFDFKLMNRLRNLRKDVANSTGDTLGRVMSNYAMERIAYLCPATPEELAKIPGLTKDQRESLEPGILEAVRQTEEDRIEYANSKNREAVQSPTYQQTKQLYLEGFTLGDISSIKGVKLSTVKFYLERLHLAGEVDFRPWIEKHIPSDFLYKGVEFFRSKARATLTEAKKVLGYEFDILRLCRLYHITQPSGKKQLKAA